MTVSPLATIKSTQLDSRTCIVAERSQIAERTSVRNSIIGPGVEVNFKTIIKDSVIMFGVKIGQG